MIKPTAFSINFAKRILLIFAVFLLLSGCSANRQVIFHVQNSDYKISVEVADSPDEIAAGLMFREKLKPDKGMLFVFNDSAARSFWTKNTLIPLDIIFISEDKRVINIAENALPCKENPCESYESSGPAKYVIEIAGGESARHEIRPGNSVKF